MEISKTEFLKNKCLWLKYPLWFRKKPQDLNSHPQVAIQAHKKQCNAITESWISGVPKMDAIGVGVSEEEGVADRDGVPVVVLESVRERVRDQEP